MAIANIRNVKICVVVSAWMGVLLAATHRSHPPVLLGRYSWSYASLLGLLVGVAVTSSLSKSAWYLKFYQARAGISRDYRRRCVIALVDLRGRV